MIRPVASNRPIQTKNPPDFCIWYGTEARVGTLTSNEGFHDETGRDP